MKVIKKAKPIIVKCSYCKSEIKTTYKKLEHKPYGDYFNCPVCKKNVPVANWEELFKQ